MTEHLTPHDERSAPQPAAAPASPRPDGCGPAAPGSGPAAPGAPADCPQPHVARTPPAHRSAAATGEPPAEPQAAIPPAGAAGRAPQPRTPQPRTLSSGSSARGPLPAPAADQAPAGAAVADGQAAGAASGTGAPSPVGRATARARRARRAATTRRPDPQASPAGQAARRRAPLPRPPATVSAAADLPAALPATFRAADEDDSAFLLPGVPAGDFLPRQGHGGDGRGPQAAATGRDGARAEGTGGPKRRRSESPGAAAGTGEAAGRSGGGGHARPGHHASYPETARGLPAPQQPSDAATARSAHPTPGGPATPPPGGDVPGEPVRETGAAIGRQPSGDRLRFVGAATRRIARGIDLDEIVLGLCRATVPTFADAILVYLRDPLPVGDEQPVGPVVLRLRRTDSIPEELDTVGGRLPMVPAQPGPPETLGGAAAELTEVRTGGPLAEVLRGVRPLLGDAPAAEAALPELLGVHTVIPDGRRVVLAPLRGRRRVIGAAVFLRRPDRAPFEAEDQLVAAQLATHTALGVDKAVLYGREAYIADALQRSMLPDSLPQPTGVRLASRYLPAAETARVGGDWYDAIPLPGSRVALVVGDVMGHSMTSAAIMGQLRTTAQTLAGLDLPPQEVLHHLDEQAQRLGSDRMATCVYAVYDPVAHRIMIANAGHPPPVMLYRGGRSEVLSVPAGAPIGVGGVDFEAVELDAPAGATLVLYTDGLVESRVRDVWAGIEQLRERLAETARLTGSNPPPLEPLCDEVLDMLGPGDRDDDIALLAARFDGISPSDVAYWYLDPKAQTAGQARRLARRALARWDLTELTDQVELLVSEVVTNAVRYAERPITLRLLRTDVLRCEVGDDVPQLPRLRQARPSDEGGRGLYLVNRMARRWGATRLSTGKVVWFELSMPPAARR
ncbi:SpoIIE family protein phosphatase [Streptomyces sp. NPDC059740]|uniref:SpoIIE family protein phosphatase n=1 Tax=Streptomyces sp. NPDC059740 TaxID=3346926 RepID=UPI00364B6613